MHLDGTIVRVNTGVHEMVTATLWTLFSCNSVDTVFIKQRTVNIRAVV